MKKVAAVVFALLFILATVGMASAAQTKNVIIREKCRSGETIAYGIYDASTNDLIDTIDAKGYFRLIDEIKVYEEKNGVHLLWNYYTNKKTGPESGTFDIDC